jgi:hypothetical protein
MRPRTPTFIWIPFVFSIGTISWALLLAGLAILAAVVISPAIADVKDAERMRNDYQATLDLLDQKIELQKEFIAAAPKDPMLMDRLASRQLNRNRPDQEVLVLDKNAPPVDRSVETLLAESLKEPTVKPVTPLPAPLAATMMPGMKQLLVLIACAAMGLSFFLGVKYERQ